MFYTTDYVRGWISVAPARGWNDIDTERHRRNRRRRVEPMKDTASAELGLATVELRAR